MKRQPLRLSALLLLAALSGMFSDNPPKAQSQSLDLTGAADSMSKFVGPRWSMIRPNRDFEGGCVVGFLAFSFSPTGYFIFNNHVRGSWQVDELGNLKLKTRDGIIFTMVVEGNSMRPTRNLPFAKRTDLYQRCPS